MQTALHLALQSLKFDALTPLVSGAKGLAVGQMLEAVLTGIDADGQANLRLADGTALKSVLPQPLPEGTRLQLQVEAGKGALPTLRLLGFALPAATPPLAGGGAHAGRPAVPLLAPDVAAAAGGEKGATGSSAMPVDRQTLSSALSAYADAGRDVAGTPQAGVPSGANDIALRFSILFMGEPRQIEVQVEPDREADIGEGPVRDGWQVRFRMDFAETGPTEARIGYQGGRLNLSLWAETDEVAAALRDRLDELRTELGAGGVAAASLAVHDGRPGASLGRHGRLIGG